LEEAEVLACDYYNAYCGGYKARAKSNVDWKFSFKMAIAMAISILFVIVALYVFSVVVRWSLGRGGRILGTDLRD
jgi:hypothetical protein